MRSTSVTAKEPVAVWSSTFSPAARSAISVTAPVIVPAPITGTSLVPVIVMVTVSVSVPPLPSATVTSYFCVTVCPAAR